SCGVIRDNLTTCELARIYEENGACSLSVLIDENFFGGSLFDLKKAKEAVSLPLLAKEFIIDEYQIYEARLYGADCILLIARLLDKDTLEYLCQVAENLGMSFIVEVHLPSDVKKIPIFSSSLILGINNRDLDTLKVDLEVTLRILKLIPPGFPVISESGITSREDIDFLRKEGVRAFLVGGALLQSKEPGRKLRELLYGED
ncbi:indole-3-glycerol-phosphate synthase, partial [Candidatus Aerophobetes bacterium]|nr:indole-3-glycerol-phosphate synthase [Candidatus Aerophobetes bacterium]